MCIQPHWQGVLLSRVPCHSALRLYFVRASGLYPGSSKYDKRPRCLSDISCYNVRLFFFSIHQIGRNYYRPTMTPQQKEAGTRVQQPPRAVVHAHANQRDPEAAPEDKTCTTHFPGSSFHCGFDNLGIWNTYWFSNHLQRRLCLSWWDDGKAALGLIYLFVSLS